MKTPVIRLWVGSILLFAALAARGEDEPPPSLQLRGPAPRAVLKEYHATVTARPELQTEHGMASLVLPAAEGRPVEFYYFPDEPWFVSMPRNKVLTFTLWQSKQATFHTAEGAEEFLWLSEVETIKDGPTLVYDAAICPLHQIRMQRAEIDIAYGLPSGEFFEAHKDFSGGPGFVLGGCVVMNDSPRKTFGYKCDQCVAAYGRWKADLEARRRKSVGTEPKPN